MKILIVTGSSGGHIFPALSLYDSLKRKDKKIDIILALPSRAKQTGIVVEGYSLRYLSLPRVRFNFELSNFAAIIKFINGSLQGLKLVIDFKPDIVVGFGSVDSLPIVAIAWLLRIKTIIHEQNVSPGKANRLLSKFVDTVAVSFPETKDYFGGISKNRLIFTGNPLREELRLVDKQEALKFFGFSADRTTILVMGGSQGSRSINAAFLEAVSFIPDKSKLQIIHITGNNDFLVMDNCYRGLSINIRLFSFLKEMQFAYSASDLAVCRAGATTIQELMFFGLPAVLLPYPFAYKHQLNNAKILEKTGAGIIVNDDESSPANLKNILLGLLNNPEKIKLARAGLKENPKFNAADSLRDAVLA